MKHFETQEPSDLEYDPQLVVVAEWRDPVDLKQDHLDNAVLDAMLEGADQGVELTYPWYKLPAVRLAKGYSWVRVLLGGHGPIPEGMSSSSALSHDVFVTRQRALAGEVRRAAERDDEKARVPALLLDAGGSGDPHRAGRLPLAVPSIWRYAEGLSLQITG